MERPFGFLSRVPCGQNRPGPRLCASEGLNDPGQGLRRYKVSRVGGRTGVGLSSWRRGLQRVQKAERGKCRLGWQQDRA